MRKLILALGFAVALQGCASGTYSKCHQPTAASPFILISDVDDTVKVTHTKNPFAALKNALASERAFAGMKELYQGLLEEKHSDRLDFVSGTPSLPLLRNKVPELLDNAQFPCYQLTLRPNLFENVGKYKEEYLKEAYGGSDGSFILIGDDTQSDPEVYEDFKGHHRGHIFATYIHQITGNPIKGDTASVRMFVTAYDIAIDEYSDHRLNEEHAAAVGEAVLRSEGSAFFPKFQKCPGPKKGEQPPNLPGRLAELQRDIETKIRELCSKRHPAHSGR